MGTTPEGETVELRVHGVSGGTAEKILDHPIVDRVAGDSHAGFYRPRPGAGPAGGASAGIAVEAYRWGALTAGTAVRTASMLLLGSPLSRLYTRLYPAYLGGQTLGDLGDRLDWRWRNLWRDTDPVGGPIFDRPEGGPAACDAPETRSVDVRLRDPSSLTVGPEDTVPPPLERHWPYHTRTAYQSGVRDLAARIG
ncbi:hypothetical protein [Micromonospora sp. NPDC005305]|uniref:hypothetical protein n=1 Tax=Micromonospora sp. NPDC005305 TaxID=3156875 RepID=UPI0033A95CC9